MCLIVYPLTIRLPYLIRVHVFTCSVGIDEWLDRLTTNLEPFHWQHIEGENTLTTNQTRRYRVNKDLWTVLRDILVGTPENFNSVVSDTLWGRYGWWPQGRLSGDWREVYRKQRDRGQIMYTICSYDTPIAWRLQSGDWVMPNVKYTMTTSKHQSKVRVALSQINCDVIG